MKRISKLAGIVVMMWLSSARTIAAQQPQVNNIPMKGDRKALKKKLKGVQDLPKRKPKGKTQVRCRVDAALLEPTAAEKLKLLKESTARPEDAFLAALLAAGGANGVAKGSCCLQLRDEDNCVWWCCGSQESHCQDDCEFAYCETK